MSHPGRILAAVSAVVVLAIAWPGQRLQAFPASVLMFYGEPLKKPVLVSGADAALFGDLTRATSSVPAVTAGRTFIPVAIFYGPVDDPTTRHVPLDRITPEMAWQHGRYYAATATQPALILATPMEVKAQVQPMPDPSSSARFVWGGPLPAAAVPVLKRLGIPTGPDR